MTPARPQDLDQLNDWTLVFDLDGTLVESAPDLMGALNHVLIREGLPAADLADVRQMIGHGAKAMIAKGLAAAGEPEDPDRVDRLWPDFLAHYEANIAVHSHAYEGCEAALDGLSEAGARLAVCTNKMQALSDRVLRELDLLRRFSVVLGSDSVPRRKPDGDHIARCVRATGGDMTRTIMVGDSQTDFGAARDAGVPFVFVTFGYEGEPAAITADARIDHYAELLPALVEIAGQAAT